MKSNCARVCYGIIPRHYHKHDVIPYKIFRSHDAARNFISNNAGFRDWKIVRYDKPTMDYCSKKEKNKLKKIV